jgi:transposase
MTMTDGLVITGSGSVRLQFFFGHCNLTHEHYIEESAEMFNVFTRSIDRWQHNFDVHGRLDPPSGLQLRGQPRLLTSNVIQSLSDLLSDAPFLYLDEIREWLALYHNCSISVTALHDNLCDLGFTHKVMDHAAAERDDDA